MNEQKKARLEGALERRSEDINIYTDIIKAMKEGIKPADYFIQTALKAGFNDPKKFVNNKLEIAQTDVKNIKVKLNKA